MRGAGPIEVTGLRKVFHQTGTGEAVVAIERLDFVVQQGEMVAIVGQTGCGKSTFLNILIGLERPTDGRVADGGRAPYDDFDHFRGVLAAVFQQDRLLPWRTAVDNVRLPLELLGRDPGEQLARARAWLDRLGLGRFERAYPHELSGGMRQRVALARAFAVEPARTEGNTAVLVTHQLEEAIEMGGRILVFGRPGRLLADINLRTWPAASVASLRADIQRMLQDNAADPRFARAAEEHA
jgi:NitT/TauT family transport system ATP-binding protein